MKNLKPEILGISLVIIVTAVVIALVVDEKPNTSTQQQTEVENDQEISQGEEEALPSTTALLANGWKLYKNQELGFSLEMPPDISVEKELNSRNNRLVIFKGTSYVFEVRLKEGQGTTLNNYLYLDFLPSGSAALGGQEAKVFKAPNGYCDGPSCGDPFVVYSTKLNKDFYNLVFYGDTALNQVEEKVFSSFKFIQ